MSCKNCLKRTLQLSLKYMDIFWLTIGISLMIIGSVVLKGINSITYVFFPATSQSIPLLIFLLGTFLISWVIILWYQPTFKKLIIAAILTLIIFALMLSLLIISGAIAFNWIPAIANDVTCQNQFQVVQLKTINEFAAQHICTVECPCLANNKSNPILIKTPRYIHNPHIGQISFAGCNAQNITGVKISYLDLLYDSMKYIEEKFNCAGFCTSSQIFLFSDVRKQVTSTQNCQQRATKYLKFFYTLYFCLLMFLNIIFVLAAIYQSYLYLYKYKLLSQSTISPQYHSESDPEGESENKSKAQSEVKSQINQETPQPDTPQQEQQSSNLYTDGEHNHKSSHVEPQSPNKVEQLQQQQEEPQQQPQRSISSKQSSINVITINQEDVSENN